MISFFAAETVPLSAEPIVHIAGFPLTNSMFYGLIMAALVLTLFTRAAARTKLKPTNKFAFVVESLVETVIKLGEENFGSRKKALKHMPLLLTLFTFILFNNLLELVPGVGSITIHNGEGMVDLFRPFTTDLNGTLAMAILTIGTVQFFALKELGPIKHFKHYFAVVTPWWNPMNAFIGLIEVMGEFIRIITLSMRLFGVIYAGDVLIRVVGQLAGNFGWAADFPIYLLELFFGGIQAYLFMMLSMVYMANATHDPHAEHEVDHSPAVKNLTAVGNK